MREIQDSGASLIDLIFQQVLADDSKVSRDGLKKYIDSHAEDILLIVDGMDEDGSGLLENKYSEVTRTLHSRKLRESCLIITTRPEYVTKLGESLKNYVIVELHGFSRENIYLYIQKYFQTAREEATRLIREIRSREYIKVLASTPVLLLMMCLLWEDQCSLPETKTQIYQEMTLYLWKIYRKKQGSDLSSDSDSDTERFDECLNDLILKLGKVALDGSVNNLQVVFRNKDFKKGILVLGCKANFITKKTTRFGATKKTTVEFLHALLQEYFAGVYLSNLLDTRRDEFDKNARQLFRYNYRGDGYNYVPNTLDFCCGKNPKATALFLRHFLKLHKNMTTTRTINIAFHLHHIFESKLSQMQCEELVPLYLCNSFALIVTQQDIPIIFNLLNLLIDSSKESIFSKLVELIINVDFSSWLPILLKCTPALRSLSITPQGFINFTLKSPDLHLMAECFRAISELSNLESLSLHSENKHELDISSLLEMLHQHKVKLSFLLLYGFQFDSKSMPQFLATATSLSQLYLKGTRNMQNEPPPAHEIMQVLCRCAKLNELSLGFFEVSSAVSCLKSIVPKLQALSLFVCKLSEKHLMTLFSFLNRAKQLRLLNLTGNPFSIHTTLAFVKCIAGMPKLRELFLDYTGLNDECACILAKDLNKRQTLHILSLDMNPIGPRGKRKLFFVYLLLFLRVNPTYLDQKHNKNTQLVPLVVIPKIHWLSDSQNHF